jgi:hypothetical protein
MQFVLTGFKQDLGFRVFAFARVGADRTRTEYTVRADLALSRRYLIPMQELPLLCGSLLARRDDLSQSNSVTFSEEDMQLYAKDCATERQAAKNRKKSSKRPFSGNLGAAWRGHARPGAVNVPIKQSNLPGERASFRGTV